MEIKLSVVIITFNEEKNILRCIESVKTVADEIVVLDSFSKDKTKEICQNNDVRFFEHPFDGHIEQKNRAISYAMHPHILSLDADEALDDLLKSEIIKIKKNWDADGYIMKRLTNYCGKWIYHCGWYPDKKLRLWDSRMGKWGGENPHDKFEMVQNATIKEINGNILHFSYYSVSDHVLQANKFTDIASKQLFEKGKTANFSKILFSSFFKFIRDYFLKLGFLDGFEGFIICWIGAYATFLKYSKLKMLNKNV